MYKGKVFLLSAFLCASQITHADMARVYHPYVEQQERELEYGLVWRDLGGDPLLLQRAGVGYAWTDRLFTEVYVLNESITHEDQRIRGYEVEVKLQLTEQGEYWADWGLLLEAGTARDISQHELAAGLLWERPCRDAGLLQPMSCWNTNSAVMSTTKLKRHCAAKSVIATVPNLNPR